MISKMKFLSSGVVLAIVQIIMGSTMKMTWSAIPRGGFCEALQLAPAASGAWTWYKSMLLTKPLITKSLTSSCIMSISDVMCQGVVAKSKLVNRTMDANPDKELVSSPKLDTRRVLDVAITGAVWSGPITHYWYIILEKMYGVIATAANIQRPEIGLIVKLILDSIIFSSVTITGTYVCVLACMH